MLTRLSGFHGNEKRNLHFYQMHGTHHVFRFPSLDATQKTAGWIDDSTQSCDQESTFNGSGTRSLYVPALRFIAPTEGAPLIRLAGTDCAHIAGGATRKTTGQPCFRWVNKTPASSSASTRADREVRLRLPGRLKTLPDRYLRFSIALRLRAGDCHPVVITSWLAMLSCTALR